MKRKLVFMDGEFTKLSEKGTRFLSIALIKESGEELYLEIAQDKEEVDEWVADNILPLLTDKKVSEKQAIAEIKKFVGDTKPTLVADVNQFDWMGICGLFGVWNIPFFYIPIDLSSILYCNGIDIDIDRDKLLQDLDIQVDNYKKHHALSDARGCKAIYEKLMKKVRNN